MALSDQVQAAIEQYLNTAFSVTTATAYIDGGTRYLLIEKSPLVSIVSIYDVDSSATVTATTYGFYSSGRIYKHDGSTWGSAENNEQFTVTYTYGYASIPDDIQLAIDTWVNYLTEDNTGGGISSYRTGDDGQVFKTVKDMPNTVKALLRGKRRILL